MKPFIAVISSPFPEKLEAAFVTEAKVIVLAGSKEEARAACVASKHEWAVLMTDEQPTDEYLASANLRPAVVKVYNL